MVNKNSLDIITAKEAVQQAIDVINEGRTGEQLALHSRHDKVKKALLGGWRLRNNYVIAGASGSGKSFYLNLLYQDFLDPKLNSEFKKPFKIIHFCFEMAAYDEILRAVSGKSKISYRELISADHILNDEAYKNVLIHIEKFKNYEIYYVESTGNVDQIRQTVMDFQGRFPQHSLLIGIDHTLLTDYKNEKHEVELVTNVSKMMVETRKKIQSTGLIIAQLNADIEEMERINNPVHHYPKKKDIHGAKAVYRDADYVIVLHAPEQLGIESYGKLGYPTKDLIAWHLIKARKGTTGIIRLRNKLFEGNITQWDDGSEV